MEHPLERTLSDIQRHSWEFFGAVARPLYITIYPPYYTDGFQEEYGWPINSLVTFEEGVGHWYMRTEDLTHLAEGFLPTILREQWKYYDRWME